MEHSLYDGSVQIVSDFTRNRHSYSLDGRKLISVSGALKIFNKPMLIPWAVKLSIDYLSGLQEPINGTHLEIAKGKWREKQEGRADAGKALHAWIENFLKTGDKTLPNDPDMLNGILAFLKWMETHDVSVVDSERLVYSRQHDYVGTLDAVVDINGRRCVIDFKSGSRVYPEHAMQIAAYRNAYEEEHGKLQGVNAAVRFDRDTGEFAVHYFRNHEADLAAFLGLLTVKKWEQEVTASKYV